MTSPRLWFAPGRLREEGDTPDYRFSLANERTFLAWIRTALALVGAGFAVDQFLHDLRGDVRTGLALVLIGIGAVCAVRAVSHWARCELAMRRGEDLPASRFPALLALAVFIGSSVLMVIIMRGGG